MPLCKPLSCSVISRPPKLQIILAGRLQASRESPARPAEIAKPGGLGRSSATNRATRSRSGAAQPGAAVFGWALRARSPAAGGPPRSSRRQQLAAQWHGWTRILCRELNRPETRRRRCPRALPGCPVVCNLVQCRRCPADRLAVHRRSAPRAASSRYWDSAPPKTGTAPSAPAPPWLANGSKAHRSGIDGGTGIWRYRVWSLEKPLPMGVSSQAKLERAWTDQLSLKNPLHE